MAIYIRPLGLTGSSPPAGEVGDGDELRERERERERGERGGKEEGPVRMCKRNLRRKSLPVGGMCAYTYMRVRVN